MESTLTGSARSLCSTAAHALLLVASAQASGSGSNRTTHVAAADHAPQGYDRRAMQPRQPYIFASPAKVTPTERPTAIAAAEKHARNENAGEPSAECSSPRKRPRRSPVPEVSAPGALLLVCGTGHAGSDGHETQPWATWPHLQRHLPLRRPPLSRMPPEPPTSHLC